MEKGYRDYGHDIDNTDSLLEAGLGFAVALDKPGGFIGRDAVVARKAPGPLPAGWCRCCSLDPEPLLLPRRGRRRDGVPSATSVPARTATRWVVPSGWPWSTRASPVTPDWLAPARGRSSRRTPLPRRGLAAADVRPDNARINV